MKLPSGMSTSSPHDFVSSGVLCMGLSKRPALGLRSFAVHFFPSVLHKVNMILLSSFTHLRRV